MHIALISLHPRPLSGEVKGLVGLGRALRLRGHSVAFTLPFPVDADGSSRCRDDYGQMPGWRALAARLLATLPRAIAAARDADVVHLALPTPAFGWFGDIVQHYTSVPVVVQFESHLAPAPRSGAAFRTSYPLLWALNNGLLSRLSNFRAARFVVSSWYQRRELLVLGAPAQRVAVIPNVVDCQRLLTCERPLARAQLGLPPNAPIVGYAGHFNFVKGVDVLADAFSRLAAAQPEAQLALAWTGQGNPEPIRQVLDRATGRVTWLGVIDVGTFLSAIDVLALPYRSTAGQSAFPALLVEGLQLGCPVVTTDLPLIREIVDPGETALVCPPEAPAALAEQLGRLLGSRPLRERLSRAAQPTAERRFDARVLAGVYERLYTTLADTGAADRRAA